MTTVTCDDEGQNIYNVTVRLCNQQTSVEEYKYEKKRNSALFVPGGYISKKEPIKILEKKTMRL